MNKPVKVDVKPIQITKGGFRVNPDGRYTGFVYHDRKSQKNVRYGQKDGWPSNIFTYEDAVKEKGKALARIDVTMTEAAKRIEWQNKYEDMDDLYQEFVRWIEKEKKAPSTIQSYKSNMKNYVYPFFLTEQGLNNLELWPKKFDEYKDYLEGISPLKISMKLSTNSRNNCIKVLNTFLTFLEKKHKKGPFPRCDEFVTTANDRRGLKDIFSEDEQQKLFAHATQVNPKLGLLFRLLSKTGLRINEALGLHTRSFTFGSVPESKKHLFRIIDEAGVDIFGYILLRDQPKLASIYDEHAKVPRGPLKSRKSIAPEFNRYIPLIDKDLTSELKMITVALGKDKLAEYEDNLIFGFTYNYVYSHFCEIKKLLGIDKDIHGFRHTFSTWIAKKCGGDPTVSQEVLGQSAKVAQLYLHLSEELEQLRLSEEPGEVKKVSF